MMRRHGINGTTRRAGSLFHVTIIYMTLASALLTTAGVVLHSGLKAETSDRRESMFLSTLLRAEQQLRHDADHAGMKYESPTAIGATSSADTQLIWTADRGILNRTEKKGDEVLATDRFLFPAGCRIEFLQDTPDFVRLRIFEASPFVKNAAAGNGATNLNKPVSETNPTVPAHVAQPNVVEIQLKGARS